MDTHSTNGVDYQYPITCGLELHGSLDAVLTGWPATYRDAPTADLADRGHPVGPYVQVRRWRLRDCTWNRTPYHDERAYVYPVAAFDDRKTLDFLP